MGKKIIGGQGVFAQLSRNKVMRLDIPDSKIMPLLISTATSIVNTDTGGMSITPDGLYALFHSSSSPFLRVLDAEAEAWVTPISSLPGSIPNDIRFNKAGTEFACALNSTPYVHRYSYSGWTLQTALGTTPAGAAVACAYGDGDDKLVLGVNASPWVQVYDLSTLANTSFTPAANAPTGAPRDVDMNDAGTMVAFCGTAGTSGIKVWSYPAGAALLYETSINAFQCKFSPDGTKLAVMYVTGTRHVRIYDTTTWTYVSISSTAQPFAFGQERALHWIENDHIWISNEVSAAIFDSAGALVHSLEHGYTAAGESFPSPLTKARKLEGNVKDASLANVARTVRAFHSETGFPVGETISDAGTGDFTIVVFTAEDVTVVAIGDTGENARAFDPVAPVAL